MAYKDKEKQREADKKRYEKNKEVILQQRKGHYKENKEVILQQQKEYNQTENGKKSQTINRWKQQGMVCEDWESLYDIYIHTWQCEYCLTEFKDTPDRHLDHCHKTLEVRGILCRSCNVLDVLSY